MCVMSLDNEVYAWGNNSMGQCGQGNSTGPITKPKKVVGLDGVAIQQISAGTSHSLAWTALPRDRSVAPDFRLHHSSFWLRVVQGEVSSHSLMSQPRASVFVLRNFRG